MTDLYEMSVSEASHAIATRRISPVELTNALIDRILKLDTAIHAFITFTPELATRNARQAEREIMAGAWRGPLHGIPLGLKDVYDTAGILTSGQSKVFRHRVPAQDAEVVSKLTKHGAVLLGKLATHEMAHGGPSFDLPWPPARNPWHTEHFTGGSSSGSAAAVAARMLPATCGSDTGGSIRGPASLCGVTGYMPSSGLISRFGMIPNSYTLDRCGPMARTVEDCAILLDILSGYDYRDAASVSKPVANYRAVLGEGLRGLRIGVVRHYWESETIATQESITAMEDALSVLRHLGAVVEEAHWIPLRRALDVKIALGEPEIFAVHAAALRDTPGQFGFDFLQRVLPACLFTAADYVNASREQRYLMEKSLEPFDRHDVLITIAQGPAPRLDAHRSLGFWRGLNTYAPANITGSPALVLCNGFVNGLPVGMQIIGRPYGDADVLRVGHAFQSATDWHTRSPVIYPHHDAQIRSEKLEPFSCTTDVELLTKCTEALARTGLQVNEATLGIVSRAAPYAYAISRRLASDRPITQSMASSMHVLE